MPELLLLGTGAALTDGMPWGEWETFPQYLDLLASRTYALDVGTQIAHGAVRYYAMGERGRVNEDATADDVAAMARIVGEAVESGALGFSTSRTIGHRSLWGTPVPGTFAARDELVAIASAMGRLGRGVFEAIPAGTANRFESRYSPSSLGPQIQSAKPFETGAWVASAPEGCFTASCPQISAAAAGGTRARRARRTTLELRARAMVRSGSRDRK